MCVVYVCGIYIRNCFSLFFPFNFSFVDMCIFFIYLLRTLTININWNHCISFRHLFISVHSVSHFYSITFQRILRCCKNRRTVSIRSFVFFLTHTVHEWSNAWCSFFSSFSLFSLYSITLRALIWFEIDTIEIFLLLKIENLLLVFLFCFMQLSAQPIESYGTFEVIRMLLGAICCFFSLLFFWKLVIYSFRLIFIAFNHFFFGFSLVCCSFARFVELRMKIGLIKIIFCIITTKI